MGVGPEGLEDGLGGVAGDIPLVDHAATQKLLRKVLVQSFGDSFTQRCALCLLCGDEGLLSLLLAGHEGRPAGALRGIKRGGYTDILCLPFGQEGGNLDCDLGSSGRGGGRGNGSGDSCVNRGWSRRLGLHGGGLSLDGGGLSCDGGVMSGHWLSV